MDKCLPVIDLFSNGQRDSGPVSEDVSSPIIWEDMSVYYLRQLASSLQVSTGVTTPTTTGPCILAVSPALGTHHQPSHIKREMIVTRGSPSHHLTFRSALMQYYLYTMLTIVWVFDIPVPTLRWIDQWLWVGLDMLFWGQACHGSAPWLLIWVELL